MSPVSAIVCNATFFQFSIFVFVVFGFISCFSPHLATHSWAQRCILTAIMLLAHWKPGNNNNNNNIETCRFNFQIERRPSIHRIWNFKCQHNWCVRVRAHHRPTIDDFVKEASYWENKCICCMLRRSLYARLSHHIITIYEINLSARSIRQKLWCRLWFVLEVILCTVAVKYVQLLWLRNAISFSLHCWSGNDMNENQFGNNTCKQMLAGTVFHRNQMWFSLWQSLDVRFYQELFYGFCTKN